MAVPIVFTKQLAVNSADSIATSQSPGAGAITLTAAIVTIDTASVANSAIGRRVLITSGGDDSSITFTVYGTNSGGSKISDTFAGAAIGTAQSNLDFVSVTKITHTGSVAGTFTAGTSTVGSSPWLTLNWHATSIMNVAFAVEVVSGSVTYSMEYTYDDPNNLLGGSTFPLPFDVSGATSISITQDGVFDLPVAAVRVLINSGTGQLRVRILQSSIG
jgi:hypothetical protein